MTTYGTFDDPPLSPYADIELAAADNARQYRVLSGQDRDLLAACKLAREQLEYVVNGWREFQGTRVSWALGKVSDAIAAAEGEQ